MENNSANKKKWLQKIRDRIRNGTIRLALLSTTLTGSGNALAETKPSPSKNDNRTEHVVLAMQSSHIITAEEMQNLIADNLIASRNNTAGNFNLNGRKWTEEELQMIGQCPLSKKIIDTAQDKAKRGAPKGGQQTYCLGAVKSFFSQNGINIDAQYYAYRAVEGLQNNENFTELEVDMDKTHSLPDGALMAWEKGTTRYGHIAMKVGSKEYCDFVYNLRTHNRRGSTGQRYGKLHVFILKDMVFSKELTEKLISEGRLKENIRKQTLAQVKIKDMKQILLDSNTTINNLKNVKIPTPITQNNVYHDKKDKQQYIANLVKQKRQKD